MRPRGTCGHVRPRAATCGHVRPRAATCGHLRPLAATCGHLRPLAATCGHLRPLAATCGHLRPLAATCGHLRPLAATCGHSSGCKWLQVGCFFEFQIPRVLQPQCIISLNIRRLILSLLSGIALFPHPCDSQNMSKLKTMRESFMQKVLYQYLHVVHPYVN